MSHVQIVPGGKLLYFTSNANESSGNGSDSTDIAPRLLLSKCLIAEGVTLRDVFRLLDSNLEKFDYILGFNCRALVAEALASERRSTDSSNEVLELNWNMAIEPSEAGDRTELLGFDVPWLSSVEYRGEDEHSVNYTPFRRQSDLADLPLSLRGPAALADLPIKLSNHIYMSNLAGSNVGSKSWLAPEGFTLGQVLVGIISDLGYFASSSERARAIEFMFGAPEIPGVLI